VLRGWARRYSKQHFQVYFAAHEGNSVMSNNGVEQIVIRHVSGSKANQIEHISLADVKEITIGRDPRSNIAFDPTRDDVVSRRHAVIRVDRGDQISFRLADLGSNNGTFLNGKQIKGEEELLPEDLIELGKNGLKFVFDVKPRPAYLAARTRVIDIGDAAATRVIETAGIAARDAVLASDKGIEPAIQKFEPPPKVGVGKETVLHLLGEERRATSRVWMSSLAGLAAVVAIGGGAIYWKQAHDKAAQIAEMKKEIAQREASIETKVTEQQADLVRKQAELVKKTEQDRGWSSQAIVKEFGNATAQIDRAWRLYDQTTGKPVFHQTYIGNIGKGKNKKSVEYPAYVDVGERNGGIVRWLTLEDDNRTNIAIGGKGSGTGFVVDEKGFMLTNKHVAAAWDLGFGAHDPANNSRYGYGWLFEYNGGPGAKDRKLRGGTLIDLSDRQFASLKQWVPSSGGYVFMKNIAHVGGPGNKPDASKGDTKTFFGRNDVLEVRFANSRISANATLQRVSKESDAALIKVDTPQELKKLDIAADDEVTVGEPVIALGYPSVAQETSAISTTIENGLIRTNTDYVPQPFVSEGIVAVVSSAIKTEHGVTVVGEMGDIIQMSINSTGTGNSGGPIFNNRGKVIGLFTYGISAGGANTSGAIPIKYGRDLLRAQHP
jgi:serine protease Do